MIIPGEILRNVVVYYGDILNSGTQMTQADYIQGLGENWSAKTINSGVYHNQLSGKTRYDMQGNFSSANTMVAVPVESTQWFNPNIELGYIGANVSSRVSSYADNDGSFYGDITAEFTVLTKDGDEFIVSHNLNYPSDGGPMQNNTITYDIENKIAKSTFSIYGPSELSIDGTDYYDIYEEDESPSELGPEYVRKFNTENYFLTSGTEISSITFNGISYNLHDTAQFSSALFRAIVYLRAKGQNPFESLYNSTEASDLEMPDESLVIVPGLIHEPKEVLKAKFKGYNQSGFNMEKSWANDNLVADVLLEYDYEVSANGVSIILHIDGECTESWYNTGWKQNAGIVVSMIASSNTRTDNFVYNEEDIIGNNTLQPDGYGNLGWGKTINVTKRIFSCDAQGGKLMVTFGLADSSVSPTEVEVYTNSQYLRAYTFTGDGVNPLVNGTATWELNWDEIYPEQTIEITVRSHWIG